MCGYCAAGAGPALSTYTTHFLKLFHFYFSEIWQFKYHEEIFHQSRWRCLEPVIIWNPLLGFARWLLQNNSGEILGRPWFRENESVVWSGEWHQTISNFNQRVSNIGFSQVWKFIISNFELPTILKVYPNKVNSPISPIHI